MVKLKSFLLAISSLCILLLLSSCGSTPTTSSSNAYQPPATTQSTPTSAPTPASAPTTAPATKPASNGYKPASANTPAPSSSTTTSAAIIKTTMLTVGGKSTMVLTDTQGKTLYYFVPDTSQQAACTGSCAATWPPLLFSGSGKASATTSLPGVLNASKNANGNQVIYNNHFLYTFSGDTSAGQTNGQGIANKWFVATPDLAKNM